MDARPAFPGSLMAISDMKLSCLLNLWTERGLDRQLASTILLIFPSRIASLVS